MHCDQQLRLTRKLSANHDLLLISAGKIPKDFIDIRRFDIIPAAKRPASLAELLFSEPAAWLNGFF
jgi:hypothetical protein